MVVWQEPHVHVQRLAGVRVRVGRASVQSRKLEAITEDRRDEIENLRIRDHAFEDFTLGDEVGETARIGLLPELAAGFRLPRQRAARCARGVR